jgi:hypothetical protein
MQIVAQLDDFVTCYTTTVDGLHTVNDCARFGLPVFDRSCLVAERKGSGPGGGIWRNGLADGLRTARFGDTALEGDDGFGDSVHDYFAVAVDHGDAANRRGQFDSGEASGFDIDETTGAHEYDDSAAVGHSWRTAGAADHSRNRTGAAWTTVSDADRSHDRREEDHAAEHSAPTGWNAAATAAGPAAEVGVWSR